MGPDFFFASNFAEKGRAVSISVITEVEKIIRLFIVMRILVIGKDNKIEA